MGWVFFVGLLLGSLIGIVAYRIAIRQRWLLKNRQLAQLVNKRNAELDVQKKTLDVAYRDFETLSQIGRELTSSFDFETIFGRLYAHVNTIMDATYFGVNIYYPDRNLIEYKFMIEKNERLAPMFVSMDKEDNLCVYCIKHNEEIFIRDYAQEYSRYASNIHIPLGEFTSSILYVPLFFEGRIIGTISTQSFEKNAYTDYHRVMLRSLASYTAIALTNAFAYEKLNQAYKEIEVKNKEIESSNLALTDSLQYARRIQEAILPHHADIQKGFDDFFIFYRPRDIVSGDFYWFTHREGMSIIAVVDCTGHGVPGAFMSVLGNSLLNQIIGERNVFTPHLILTYLNEAVKQTLKQDQLTSDSNDGMDIGLCVIDHDRRKLHFAGANRPLYFVQEGSVKVEKGDRYPIGGRMEKHNFATQSIDYQEGFTFYLTTDGFNDQFGGTTTPKRKFSNVQLIQLFQDICHLPMEEQRQRLNQAFEDWKGNHKQIDDVLVIGIRL